MNQKSKIIISILALVILGLGGLLLKNKNITTTKEITTPEQPIGKDSISSKEKKTITIREENFSGSRPVLEKNTLLEKQADAYINQEIESFKKMADEEVPQKRQAETGDQPELVLYTIDIRVHSIKSPTTQSIVIDEDTYTGGASDHTLYKTFTASQTTGKIIVLSDVIIPSKRGEFTTYVKKALQNWRPEKSVSTVVFPEEVAGLTFEDFANWSMDSKNLTLYFDKYTIGPGALGAIAFPLSLSNIKTYSNPTYLKK